MSEEKDVGVWVVMPIGWGYDDNSYSREGYEIPRHCFTIKEMALEFAKECNINRFRDVASDSYFGGYVEDWWLNEETIESLKVLGVDMEARRIPGEILSKLSEAQIIEIMRHLELKFFDVAELKIVC